MLLHSLLIILAFGKWGWRRLTQLDTVQQSNVHSSACVAQQLGTIEPCSVISSMLMWINRYATFCNALFSKMQRIPQKCKQNFGGELPIIATPNWCSSACDSQHLGTVEPWPHVPIPTHVNTKMCNPLKCTVFEEAEHPWIGYASILGVRCPPLLHWCSQCYMCCSTASHCSSLSSQYTDMPSFAMHRFQGYRAWLKSL